MAFDAQLGALDDAVLGHLAGSETIAYRPGSGFQVELRAIFEEAFQILAADDLRVMSSGPAVFVRLEDLPSDPETDREARVLVNGTVHRIARVQADGQGGAVLILHRA